MIVFQEPVLLSVSNSREGRFMRPSLFSTRYDSGQSRGPFTASRNEQNDAADQGGNPHDGIEHDGVRPLHVHLEWTGVYHPIRGEESDSLEH
jgi:hypothetical protein